MIGHLYTEGVVKADYPDQIKAQIAALPAECSEIHHHIKSPGGNVYAAWKAIPELMKIGKPVKTIIEGEASSIASWLAIVNSYEVEATDPSTMMIHEPFFPEGLDGALGVDDLESAKIELSQIRQSMAEAYAKKSGKTVEEWLAFMKATTRLTANMAKQYGLVDKVTSIEPRRIAAEFIEEFKSEVNQLIMGLFSKKAAPAAQAAAMDLPLKDGKVLNVQSEDGNLVGKPATVDGVPAEGTFELADGKKVVCAGGVVTEVMEAAPPAESEADKMKKELEMVKGQLAQLTAAKAAEEAKIKAEEEAKAKAQEAEEAKIKAEQLAKEVEESKKTAQMLAEKLEQAESKTIGNTSKPNEGMESNRTPVGFAKTGDDKKAIMATRTFLADNMPWLERHYGGKYSDGTEFHSYRTGGPNAVSILETNLNYTWNGILDTDIFFKPTLGTPALADLCTVDLGASHLKRYHIAPTASKVLKPYTGCDQAVTGTSLDITSKFIQIKPFRMKEKWCKDDFTNQLSGSYNELAQQWLKTGNASFDPAGTPVDRIIVNLLKDALRRDVFRRISFGDTTSSNADYNQIDGYWQSLIDQSGASNYCVYRAGSALGTGALAGGTALTALEAVFTGSNILLKQGGIDKGRAKFFVTRSIWENLYASYAANGAVTEIAMGNLINGISGQMTYKGIPVVPVNAWDADLADSNNPLSSTTRHLISFTVPDNHIIGVENTGDLGAIKSWFSDDDNVRYYSAQMSFGFLGAMHCELTTVAY